jgi:hypothetical protein
MGFQLSKKFPVNAPYPAGLAATLAACVATRAVSSLSSRSINRSTLAPEGTLYYLRAEHFIRSGTAYGLAISQIGASTVWFSAECVQEWTRVFMGI